MVCCFLWFLCVHVVGWFVVFLVCVLSCFAVVECSGRVCCIYSTIRILLLPASMALYMVSMFCVLAAASERVSKRAREPGRERERESDTEREREQGGI